MAGRSTEVGKLSEPSSATDKTSQPTATLVLRYLPRLFEELRNSGFSVGVEQYIAVEDLLIGLAASHAFPLHDSTVFCQLLRPLFAKSPLQQEIFSFAFQNWLQKLPPAKVENSNALLLWSPTAQKPGRQPGPKPEPILPFWYRCLRWLTFIALIGLAVWGAMIFGQLFKGVTNGANPTTGGATPPIPSGLTSPEKKLGWLGGPFILIATTGAFLVTLVVFLRRRSAADLTRRINEELPEVIDLHLTFPPVTLFRSNLVAKVSYDLRRGRWVNQDRLDVQATVLATVRAGGFLTPISLRRRTTPEYVVLVDRRTSGDHTVNLTESLLERLAEDGVSLTIYYFDRSARFCFPRTSRKRRTRAIPIDNLPDRHSDSRLLIFADLLHVLDPGTESPQNWIRSLAQWEFPAVFVRRSDVKATSVHNVLRSLGFSIFPASTIGLRGYADLINGEHTKFNAEEPHRDLFTTTPTILEREPFWLANSEPNTDVTNLMLANLRKSLGPAVTLCLSACAVYPQIKWELTVYLVEKLYDARNTSESLEEVLGNLSLLPWFRHGRMPDWLRMRLIGDLRPKDNKKIRRLLVELLLSALKSKAGLSGILQIAQERANVRSAIMRDLAKRAPDTKSGGPMLGNPLREYVFASFMVGNELSFRLPKAIRPLFDNARPNLLSVPIRIFSYLFGDRPLTTMFLYLATLPYLVLSVVLTREIIKDLDLVYNARPGPPTKEQPVPSPSAEVSPENQQTQRQVSLPSPSLSPDNQKLQQPVPSPTSFLSPETQQRRPPTPSPEPVQSPENNQNEGPSQRAGPAYLITGQITDSEGSPVPGAVVSAAGATTTSDSDGYFALSVRFVGSRAEDVFELQIEKPGYYAISRTIKATRGVIDSTDIRVTLTRTKK
jgi:hypothetical protein